MLQKFNRFAMKKGGLLLLSLFLLSAFNVSAQFEGTFGIGVHAGYGEKINSPGMGAHLHYYPTNQLRIAPSCTFFLPTGEKKMWMMDADAHYILPLSYAVSLYPVAGIHYSHWKLPLDQETEPVAYDKENRVGTNLGAGFQYDIRFRIRANLECKYQFIPGFSQWFIAAGFGFWF